MFLLLRIRLIYVDIVGGIRNLDKLLIVRNINVSFIKMICLLSIVTRCGLILINYWVWDGRESKLVIPIQLVHVLLVIDKEFS